MRRKTLSGDRRLFTLRHARFHRLGMRRALRRLLNLRLDGRLFRRLFGGNALFLGFIRRNGLLYRYRFDNFLDDSRGAIGGFGYGVLRFRPDPFFFLFAFQRAFGLRLTQLQFGKQQRLALLYPLFRLRHNCAFSLQQLRKSVAFRFHETRQVL